MPSSTRRAARGAAGGLLVALLLLAAWAAVAALSAREGLLRVRDVATDVRDNPPGSVAELRAAIAPARRDAARARERMTAPGPMLVARLPLVGRTLAAERDAALAADALLRGADEALEHAERLSAEGGIDVDVLARLAARLDQTAAELRGPAQRLEQAEPVLVPGSVRTAVREAADAVSGVDATLEQAAGAARAAAGLLGSDEPRTLVVLLMNNAELRGAGGYGGSFAVVETDRGRVEVSPFRDVNDVQASPQEAVRVPAPPDYSRRWGPYLADTTLWKNVLMSADQPSAAAVACAVAQRSPGVPCDGVVLLDVRALALLVELTGPLDLGSGERVSGDALVEALLVDAYAEVADTAGDQWERRRRLRAAADDAVSALLRTGIGDVDTVRALVDAGRGRHLAVWSADQAEQAAITAAGLDGGVVPAGDDLNLVSVNQLSAGKLDYYVTRSVGLLARVGPDEALVTQRVTLRLDPPPGLPRYVLGVRDGALEELMDVALPLAATDIEAQVNGRPITVAAEEENGSLRLPFVVVLGAGQTATWEVTYRVPLTDGQYRLRLIPQPLARDAVLHLAVVPADGARLRDGDVIYDGPYDRTREVAVQAEAG